MLWISWTLLITIPRILYSSDVSSHSDLLDYLRTDNHSLCCTVWVCHSLCCTVLVLYLRIDILRITILYSFTDIKMPRTARTCVLCGAKVVKLSNHLAQVHKVSKEDRNELLKKARVGEPDPRSTGQPQQKRRKKMCPVEGCGFATDRLHDHLSLKHGLAGETWRGPRLELLNIATKQLDNEGIDEEDEDMIGMVPFKVKGKIDSISLKYLRPDCEQQIEECMLPLPNWCHEEELKEHLQRQEDVDPETIFGNKTLTVDLRSIFKTNKRKRKHRT